MVIWLHHHSCDYCFSEVLFPFPQALGAPEDSTWSLVTLYVDDNKTRCGFKGSKLLESVAFWIWSFWGNLDYFLLLLCFFLLYSPGLYIILYLYKIIDVHFSIFHSMISVTSDLDNLFI